MLKRIPKIRKSDVPRYKWLVSYWGEDGKSHREYFNSEAQAKSRARELKQALEAAGKEALSLSPQRLALLKKVEKVQEELRQLGSSLEEALDLGRKQIQAERLSPVWEEAVGAFLEAKSREVGPRRFSDLRRYLRHATRFFGGRKLGGISRTELWDYLEKQPSVWTARNVHRVLSVFFNYSRMRQWILNNPIAEIPVPRPKPTEPQTFSPVDVQKLLLYSLEHDPKCLPPLALGFFAGIRTAELCRLTWKDINITDKQIRIQAGKAKTASTRIIDITEPLSLWLDACQKDDPSQPVSPSNLNKRLRKLADKAEVKWVPNGMRHSFASYHLALYENAGKTAAILGHTNPSVTYRHYCALRTKEEAKEYFLIKPPITLPEELPFRL